MVGNTRSLQGAAMHPSASLLWFLLAFVSTIGPAWGQAPDRATRARSVRQGAQPGEIITAPDLSEQWPDQLRVGEAAPEFTLPIASGAEDAKAIAERSNRDAKRGRNKTKGKETAKT